MQEEPSNVPVSRLVVFSALPALLSLVAVSFPVPVPWSPYPSAVVYLLFQGLEYWHVAVLAALSFAIFNIDVLFGARIGKLARLPLTLGVLTTLTAWYFYAHIGFAITYYGWLHVGAVTVMNVGFMAGCWWYFVKSRSTMTARQVLLVGLLIHCWVCFCAFPYLGELP